MSLPFSHLYHSQNNRDTYLNKELNQYHSFVTIEAEVGFLRYDFEALLDYEEDKIKFITKVQTHEEPTQGIRSKIKIAKDPIYVNQDTIIFLLIFEWFPNSDNSIPKTRKGSFATQKQISNKVRYQKAKMQQQQLVSIVYLLSQKIYVDQKYVDIFTKIVETKHETSHKQVNCMTVVLNNTQEKRNLPGIASTMAETRCQFYCYQSTPIRILEERNYQRSLTMTNKNQQMSGRGPINKRHSSRLMERSLKTSQMSSEMHSDGIRTPETKLNFNLKKVRMMFSSVEYIITQEQISPELIIYHLNDSQNIIGSGFRLQAIKEAIQQWPKYKSFPRFYKLNRDKIIRSLTSQATHNYRLMIQMELAQLDSKNIQKIYHITNELNNKIMDEFFQSIKEYINDADYNDYVQRLQAELGQLESELLNNYAQTRKEYGTRTIKNFQKKNYKNGIENYTLMKILGKEQINELQLGYKMYKQIVETNLDLGFKQFVSKKGLFRNRFTSKFPQNYELQELNYVQSRIQICQEKKKMLDLAIQLESKQTENLKMMLKIIDKDDRRQSNPTEQFTL